MASNAKAQADVPRWKDDYRTGIASIDEQHRHFFNVVADLMNKARGGGLAHSDQEAALEELINYACYHFSTEEEWMQTHAYPEKKSQAHKREHEQFVDAVKRLRTRMYAGEDVFFDLLTFAGQWLVQHITKTDTEYARFARSR